MASGGQGSSKFKREGTGTYGQSWSNVPQGISDLITGSLAGAQTDPGLATQQRGVFSRLMEQTPESQPGFQSLTGFANLSPIGYTGHDTLQRVAERDPFSSTFEAQTEDAFRQRAGDAMSMAATGPDAVRGGDARTGIAQGVLGSRLAQDRGQEVRQAQLQDLLATTGAATAAAGIEGQRANTASTAAQGLSNIGTGVADRGLGAARAVDFNKVQNLALLQLASQLQGTQLGTTVDNFSGHGSQSGWQSGLNCCFVFLQALNGKLPWYIEVARLEYWTRERRDGYCWMASWLVPVMKASKVVSWLVNATMVKPFLRYGAWMYADRSARQVSVMYAPLCESWLALWGWLGKH
jgi:hypothetical protein